MSASYERAAPRLRLAAVLLAFLAVPALAVPALAVPASAQAVADIAEARVHAERAHLWRVGAWGAANVAAGAVLIAGSEARTGRRAFGIQSAAWGAVNAGIAVVGLTGSADSLDTLADVLRAENGLGDVLWLNMGLNAGYVAVGATLWIVASRGVANPAAWRGHGQAVVLQGAALLALDGIALAASHARLGALLDLVQTAALVPTGHGLMHVVPL